MLPENKIIVSCLILYAFFQFYQVYSSFTSVYLDEDNNWQSHKHGLLTAFHIFGLLTSSILLIVGSLKSKPWLLVGGLSYLLYKLGFIFWHFGKFYDMTLGCDKNCLPGHIAVFLKHLAVTVYLITAIVQCCMLIFTLRSRVMRGNTLRANKLIEVN